MKSRASVLILVFAGIVAFSGGSKPDYDKAGMAALRSIDTNTIRSSLVFLASDSLQGRETTEPGQKMAARYISGKFASFGLKPLGDDGTFLQHFPVDVHYISDSSYFAADGKYFRYDQDMIVMPFGAGETDVKAPVVFAGYGYENESYSDYDGIDVKHKIVLLLGGNPSFADSTDIFVKSGIYKRTNALKHGAAAVLIAERGGEEVFSRMRRRFSSYFGARTMSLVSPRAEQKPSVTQMQVANLDEEASNALLGKAGETVERLAARIDSSRKPVSLQLGEGELRIKIVSVEKTTENVVGGIEGSDPLLRNEYVVYSAHYDHLGMTSDGVIFHGADDDASGTSTVIGVAEAYAKSPVKPRRSIIFLAVTGEEKGLLGSSYFVSHPVVPLNTIVADLNTDMDGRIDSTHAKRDSNYVYVIGSKKLSGELDSLLVAADSSSSRLSLDYYYDRDDDPNRFYYRSDQYNFAKNDIPIIFFFSGDHPDYHKPTDTSDKIDYPVLARRAGLIFLTGWKVANLEGELRRN